MLFWNPVLANLAHRRISRSKFQNSVRMVPASGDNESAVGHRTQLSQWYRNSTIAPLGLMNSGVGTEGKVVLKSWNLKSKSTLPLPQQHSGKGGSRGPIREEVLILKMKIFWVSQLESVPWVDSSKSSPNGPNMEGSSQRQASVLVLVDVVLVDVSGT